MNTELLHPIKEGETIKSELHGICTVIEYKSDEGTWVENTRGALVSIADPDNDFNIIVP